MFFIICKENVQGRGEVDKLVLNLIPDIVKDFLYDIIPNCFYLYQKEIKNLHTDTNASGNSNDSLGSMQSDYESKSSGSRETSFSD